MRAGGRFGHPPRVVALPDGVPGLAGPAGRVELRGTPAGQREAVATVLVVGGLWLAGVVLPAARGDLVTLAPQALAPVGITVASLLALRGRRGDVVVADADGLHVRTGRRTESIRWEALRDLGWWGGTGRRTAFSPFADAAGLVVRRRAGGSYEAGGPLLPGPLASPVGVTRAQVDALRDVAEAHGAVWADYAAPGVPRRLPPRASWGA